MKSRAEFEEMFLNLKDQKNQLIKRHDRIQDGNPMSKKEMRQIFTDCDDLDLKIRKLRKDIDETMQSTNFPIYYKLWISLIDECTSLQGIRGFTYIDKQIVD